MKRYSVGTPLGFRDILFEEARKRRRVESRLAEVFQKENYREILTSGIEYCDVYERGNQSVRERVFRFLDRDDQLLALRADFTPAIARVVATSLAHEALPLRIWYSGNVFRKVPPNRGLFRETTQLGAELIGTNSTRSDAEILLLAIESLHALGINDFQIHLNHAGVFDGIVSDLKLQRSELVSLQSEILRKDGRGLEARLRQMGVSTGLSAQLDSLSRCVGDREVLAQAKSFLRSSTSQRAVDELIELSGLLNKWKGHIMFDLTEIDEMEYYTGVMFTFFSPALKGELGGGGRYDDLIAAFGVHAPACGFSLSMEQLVELV